MNLSYIDSAEHLLSLIQTAKDRFHRFGVVLDGSEQWQQQTLAELGQLVQFNRAIELGSDLVPYTEPLPFKQGKKILGQESDLIVADLNQGFDADGLTAACGTLKGGGVLILLPKRSLVTPFDSWLSKAMGSLVQLSESGITNAPLDVTTTSYDPYSQQRGAIEAIHKVLSGHRKRPLVITADRGRGKSSALGIASAEVIRNSNKKILVTAPSKSAVSTLIERASDELQSPFAGSRLESETGGCIEYVAPDELLRSMPSCDLLLVDEASAIPLPLLKQMVDNYHRVCFSTTVHGYEGCGRGFSLKFEPWLEQNRPGWKALRLSQPIRWNPEDPLEAWLFDAFLLNAEVESLVANMNAKLKCARIEINELLQNRALLAECFGLLVNAHYQTSPNDLVQLLNDSLVSVYRASLNGKSLAVLLAVEEGGLDKGLVHNVMIGQRRPAGHLVPVALANHLATEDVAIEKSVRVMRIAVHPELQGEGIGSLLLDYVAGAQPSSISYMSTSFGATAQLLRFWTINGFEVVRLGTKQDQASGCFSSILIKPLNNSLAWLQSGTSQMGEALLDTASDYHLNLQTNLLFELLKNSSIDVSHTHRSLLNNYIKGGNGFETCRGPLARVIVYTLNRTPEACFDKNWGFILSASIKKMSWADLATKFGFSGRKQAEKALREAISEKLSVNLQCK